MFLFALMTLALPLSTIAFPFRDLISRQKDAREGEVQERSVNCNGTSATPYDSSCYATLGISDWLKNWNKTVPTCSADQDGSTCCGPSGSPNEAWSTCFLRLALADSGHDCTTIKIKNCELEGFKLAPSVNASDMAQTRYVIWTIYSINSFFSDWYTATNNAANDASHIISAVTDLIDPPNPTNMVLSDILTALTAGLALLGLPEVTAVIKSVAAEAATVGNVLSTSLQQAPGVAKAIWPPGATNDPTFPIAQLSQELGKLETQTRDMLTSGLAMIMTDVPTFTSFASSGGFSGNSAPSLPDDTAGLDIAFQTYVVTSAMAGNQWLAFYGPPYTGNGPTGPFNSSSGSQGANFGCVIESSGVCDIARPPDPFTTELMDQPVGWSEWTSQATSRSYYANQAGHKNNPTSAVLTNALVTNGWTTPALIFDGGYNCSQNGGAGGGKALVSVSDHGTLDFSCLSQLSVKSGCKNAATWQTAGKKSGCCDFFNTC